MAYIFLIIIFAIIYLTYKKRTPKIKPSFKFTNVEEMNKKLAELLRKNQAIFDEFSNKVLNVELNIYSKTFTEFSAIEKSSQNSPGMQNVLKNMPRESMVSLLGLKPFIEYGKLVIDLINKIAVNEKRAEIVFRKDEVSNHDKWLARMAKIKDGGFWIYLRATAFDAIHAVHDARVKAITDKASQEFKKSHPSESEKEIYDKNWKLLQNLFKGEG